MWSSVLGTHGIVQEFKHRGALRDRILLLMFDHCHFQSCPKECGPAVSLEEWRDAGSPFASWSLYSRGYSPSPPGCSSHSGQRPELGGMVMAGYTQLTVPLGSSSRYAKPSVESSKVLWSQDFSFTSFWNMSSFKRLKDTLCPFSFPVYYCKIFPHLLKIC